MLLQMGENPFFCSSLMCQELRQSPEPTEALNKPIHWKIWEAGSAWLTVKGLFVKTAIVRKDKAELNTFTFLSVCFVW